MESDGGLAVEVRGLGFTYPASRRCSARPALVDLDFEVEQGRILGFLGPNGGGKSTLFRILATLLRHQSGTVKVLGVELPDGAAEVRRELGVVFQEPSLDPHLTVRENLTTQGRLYGLGRDLATRVEHRLARFALGDRAGDYARALSGGLARRVEIAKALIHQPRLLLLDEPSSGLDPRARLELWEQLERLRDEGVTVLLTTHFTEEADRCDQLALIDQGRLVVVGEPAELKQAVGGDVVTVIASDPYDLAGEMHSLIGVTAKVHRDQVRFEYHGAASLLGRLAEAFPGRIESMSVAKPTLEDVFIAHTGHGLSASEG
jgi:ABC-2 type transport system ATP-binding protein